MILFISIYFSKDESLRNSQHDLQNMFKEDTVGTLFVLS